MPTSKFTPVDPYILVILLKFYSPLGVFMDHFDKPYSIYNDNSHCISVTQQKQYIIVRFL